VHVAIWFYVAKEKDSIYIYRERENTIEGMAINGWYQLDEKQAS